MALSNIFREPGKEIAETAIGIVAVGPIIGALLAIDYFCVAPLLDDPGTSFGEAMAFGAFMMILGALLSVCLLGFVHFVGEKTVDAWRRRQETRRWARR